MIGRLQGILLDKQAPQLIIDIAGVGYEVDAPMSTFYRLPELGQTVCLFIHMVVREDAQLLYGFYTEQERRLFRNLIRINGVGPKLAITILSGIEPEQFAHCIRENDTGSLVRLPGVGKKTAERLIIEMRDRISDWQDGLLETLPQRASSRDVISDAISALAALGYKASEASKAVSKVNAEGLSTETLIRKALQQI